ncbi:hypothetical protein EU245_07815 [Lentibacillus lipolyticus]|nr:hypothetical protein EU245_07815 [Lentibacillus lipolyticus]
MAGNTDILPAMGSTGISLPYHYERKKWAQTIMFSSIKIRAINEKGQPYTSMISNNSQGQPFHLGSV